MLETADETLIVTMKRPSLQTLMPIKKKYGATSHNFLWSFVFRASEQMRPRRFNPNETKNRSLHKSFQTKCERNPIEVILRSPSQAQQN